MRNSLAANDSPPPSSVSFWEALRFWLKLGFISFGGPAGQIALMHQELVERKKWISNGRFLHALNYCMLLPGPEAQQLATYIGWLLHRSIGGITAGALFVLPSLFILILLSWLYIAYAEYHLVADAFYGIKPAVTAIVLHSAYRIGTRVLYNTWMRTIAAMSLVAIALFQAPFPYIITGAACIGFIGERYLPTFFGPKNSSKEEVQHTFDALINDTSQRPTHTHYSHSKVCRVLVVGFVLWTIPLGFLLLTFGSSHLLPKMALFFTQVAFLTFGGAYAVLPYVFQRSVHDFGWLSAQQMIDGLALGETTPGPLIMVVAFVGFVGGYLKSAVGANYQVLSGVVAACVVTWFTFLPSFLFIFGGGPLVESTRDRPSLAAPLTCISAAIVGVIINLAVFFGMYVFVPSLTPFTLDWGAVLISAGAYVCLSYYSLSTIVVITLCALAGMVLRSDLSLHTVVIL